MTSIEDVEKLEPSRGDTGQNVKWSSHSGKQLLDEVNRSAI